MRLIKEPAASVQGSTADRYVSQSKYITDTLNEARGRWLFILEAIGIPATHLRNKHGKCPIQNCGGKDRFRFDNKGGKGTWICNQCGAGNGLELVKQYMSCSTEQAVDIVNNIIGKKSTDPVPKHISTHLASIKRLEEQVKLQELAKRELERKISLILSHAIPASSNHSYLVNKRVRLNNLKTYKNAVIVKIYHDHYNLVSLQLIDQTGNKRFLPGTPKKGAYSIIGKRKKTDPIIIAEGFATAASIYLSTGIAVFVAFDCQNLFNALQTILLHFRHNGTVVIGADNDKSEIGFNKAADALARINVTAINHMKIIMPIKVGFDWNDVYCTDGAEVVLKAFKEVIE